MVQVSKAVYMVIMKLQMSYISPTILKKDPCVL